MTASILIVEDDDDLREGIRMMLELGTSHRVRAASDGARALEAIAEELPDLILLDMKMPKMNGWALADGLRTRGLKIPIVVCTAAEDARARAEEIGAEGWLTKPFDYDDLLAAVEKHRRRDPAPKPE